MAETTRPSVVRGLLPEDPFLETYLVRPGGATVLALGPDERITVVDKDGGQVAEVTVLDAYTGNVSLKHLNPQPFQTSWCWINSLAGTTSS